MPSAFQGIGSRATVSPDFSKRCSRDTSCGPPRSLDHRSRMPILRGRLFHAPARLASGISKSITPQELLRPAIVIEQAGGGPAEDVVGQVQCFHGCQAVVRVGAKLGDAGVGGLVTV